jgi:hypothetical protein
MQDQQSSLSTLLSVRHPQNRCSVGVKIQFGFNATKTKQGLQLEESRQLCGCATCSEAQLSDQPDPEQRRCFRSGEKQARIPDPRPTCKLLTPGRPCQRQEQAPINNFSQRNLPTFPSSTQLHLATVHDILLLSCSPHSSSILPFSHSPIQFQYFQPIILSN